MAGKMEKERGERKDEGNKRRKRKRDGKVKYHKHTCSVSHDIRRSQFPREH